MIDEEPARLYFAYAGFDRFITMKAHPVGTTVDQQKDSLDADSGRANACGNGFRSMCTGYGDIKLITALCGQFNVPLVKPGAERPAEIRPASFSDAALRRARGGAEASAIVDGSP